MRTFLSLLLLLTWCSPGPAASQSRKPLYTFPIGVQAYTYRNWFPKNVVATLDTIHKLGITEMEGGVPKGMTTEEFKKLLRERNIRIPATGASYEELVKDPLAVAQKAKDLGATFVMVAWIPHQRGNFDLPTAQKAVEDFNRAGKVLHDNGITFCYHNHGYEFQPYQNGTLFDYLVANTNPAHVSFELDIFWAQHGGADPVALLTKYGSRWKLMHLKDLRKGVRGDLTGGTAPENDVVLGQGQIDIPAVLKAAKKAGIRHYFIEDESNLEGRQVPLSIAYLKNLRD